MSDLKDFLNLIAEGKKTDPSAKRAQQIKENIKGDLSGLFIEIVENKKVDPVAIRSQQIKEKIKFDLSDMFSELSSLKQKKEELEKEVIAEAQPEPIVEEVVQEEKTEEVLIEVSPIQTPIGVVAPENQIPDLDKYLKTATPKEPEVSVTQRDIKTVNDKIKFLEQWISKIQNTGPGSGEVNLRYLDDVDKATIGDGKYLNYNATTKKFQFSTISGGTGGSFSGSYNDLTDKPTIPDAQVNSDWNAVSGLAQILNKPILFSGSYTDLTNKPTLFSGSYTDLANKPTLFSGSYTDLSNKPSLFSGAYVDLTGKPTLFSGSYTDLTDKPSIPSLTGYATETYVGTAISNLVNTAPATLDTLNELAAALGNDANFSTTIATALGNKADKTQLFSGAYADLTGKPTLFSGAYADLTGKPTLSTVAGTGAYADLTGKPSLFSGSYTDLTNKPTLFSGSYTDLTNKPTLFSGAYADLTGKPTLGTISSQSDSSVSITGGSINGTTVGATTPATGSFTTLIGGAGSANYVQIVGAASAGIPVISAQGSDTNINLTLTPKGTGRVIVTTGIKARVNSIAVAAGTTSQSWTSDSYDQYNLTLSNTATLTIGLDTGVPTDGQKMMFRIKDDGTVRNIAWTTSGTNCFRVVGTTLPTSTTTINKLTYVGCIYNATASTWDVVAVGQEV
jgi:hypothetical protein